MGDEHGGTPASPSSDQHDTPVKTCKYCGTSIDTGDWYPVTKERDSDGTLQLYPFCSEDCQDAWLDEQPD